MQFEDYLKSTGEVGYIEEAYASVVYVSGLPGAKPGELARFETGEVGQIMSLSEGKCEVLLFESVALKVGARVARTGEFLKISLGPELLGAVIDPLGKPFNGFLNKSLKDSKELKPELREIHKDPPGIETRKKVNEPLETGVSVVDLTVPLGKGQRELIIGNRRTGKTEFLFQAALTQVKQGSVVVYAGVGKRWADIKKVRDFFERVKIVDKTVMVVTGSDDPSGFIYLTPFSAMTIAEYFRDHGMNVLLILDDLTAHAKYYRELSLLSRRFPGRSSYPGDIFYVHARLLERAGNFESGSISCLPVAEMVFGDFSGYIPTNIMSMTDGHLYFDTQLYNEGRRPAINPFLSVTRVGRQTQSNMGRDLSRQVTSFMVHLGKIRQFMHFGAELNEQIKRDLDMGDKLTVLFDQANDIVVPASAGIVCIGLLWAGYWKDKNLDEVREQMAKIIKLYAIDTQFKVKADALITDSDTFASLIENIKQGSEIDPYLSGEFKTQSGTGKPVNPTESVKGKEVAKMVRS